MLVERSRPVRRGPVGTAPLAQAYRPLQSPDSDANVGERRPCVNDDATAVAGVVSGVVGIGFGLQRAVPADIERQPLVDAPRERGPRDRRRAGITECTAAESSLGHDCDWVVDTASTAVSTRSVVR